MNDRNFDQLLNAWMDLGPTTAPDRVADAARLEAATMRQLPAMLSRWAPRRFPVMNTTAKILVATAAVVVAAILGFNYLIAPNVGNREIVEPSPTATSAPDLNDQEGLLAPGPYSVTLPVPQITITFTVPNGWTKNVVPSVVWTDNSEARVAFGDVSQLFQDPCQPDLGLVEPVIGPTIDDLATALAAIPGVQVTTADVALSGFSGTRVDVTAPPEFADCIESGGEAQLNTTAPFEPGVHSFWILDVDGTRVVVQGVARTRATESQSAALQEIVNSIQIR